MKDFNSYRDRLNELKAEIKHAEEQFAEAVACTVEQCSPYKVGDIVPIQGTYSHAGKKMMVESVRLTKGYASGSSLNSYANPVWKWCLRGPLIKKADGKPGKMHASSFIEAGKDGKSNNTEHQASEGARV